jgi:hypothetical protein
MSRKDWLKSSRLFIYLGFALIILGIATFSTRAWVEVQPGVDFDLYWMGWGFAPIIGVWGFASVIFGLVQSSISKDNFGVFLSVTYLVMGIGLAFSGYMAVAYGLPTSYGSGNQFWWIYFSMFLIPSKISAIVSYLYFRKKGWLDRALAKRTIRVIAFCTLLIIPLLYSAVFMELLRV